MAENPLKIRDYVNPNLFVDSFKQRTGLNSKRNKDGDNFLFSTLRSKADITNDTKDSSRSDNMIQTRMRFKAKNDVERVTDEINKYSYGRVPHIKLNDIKLKHQDTISSRDDLSKRLGKDEILEENLKISKFSSNNNNLDNRSNYSVEDKTSLNYLNAKKSNKSHSEFHKKTHFKAASDIAAFNS